MSFPLPSNRPEFTSAARRAAEQLVAMALAEDFGERGDVTSTLFIDSAREGQVDIGVRQPGALAGLPIVPLVLQQVDSRIEWTAHTEDGDRIQPGQVVGTLSGSVQKILMAERTILNFLTHLSGVATLTSRYADLIAGTQARILDTRKTLPGYRLLEKYAVRCGGGENHRMGLYDAVMLKDNHLASMTHSHPDQIVADVRARYPGIQIIVEVDQLEQIETVLKWDPDVILLDNMPPEKLLKAVQLRDAQASDVQLEASGGITRETIAEVAQSGVDRISVGEITHSAPSLDLGFDWHV
ncbi:carboxylating nicotinate-nucleotide diphosphorylase [Rubinisphaera margarita]|uniref:carboxylating nicotinate-nucleotide diphosphorylase n=1 Tax=Rubinisphaera margarita TaxID=2909586 RepID=UPI001EE85F9F|nr:carboxylating nicotinate-nucleotide diphosphorylase [Rubinisphaera margarita]MCG6154838.1 carboxylating nicotinate-nucleotide diphosphorylase [Rubinisphaera margarita]